MKRVTRVWNGIVDFFLGRKLDCGSRSNDWIDHLNHDTPECRAAMRRYWSEPEGATHD